MNLQSHPGHMASVFSGAALALDNFSKFAVLYSVATGATRESGQAAERIQEQQRWVTQ